MSELISTHRLYAQILLDIQIQGLKDRLFTYRVPEHLEDTVFVGSQVLVPFGPRQMVAGYVTAVERKSGADFDFRVRDLHDVVDPLPLFGESYIDFLAYVAKRYCASMQDVIAASVPACLVSKVKRYIKLEKNELLDKSAPLLLENRAQTLLVELLKGSSKGILNLTILRQRFEKLGRQERPKLNAEAFHRALKDLTVRGLISTFEEEEEGTNIKTKNLVHAGEIATKTAKQAEILTCLQEFEKSPSIPELIEKSGSSRSTIDKMVKEGMLKLAEEEVVRDSLSGLPAELVEKFRQEPKLTAEQEEVFAVLLEDLSAALSDKSVKEIQPEPWLLHGVTGSGKTEVYLRLISQALKADRTTLFLVPEISLTPQLSGRLRARFGNKVSVWHSAISAGERYDTFRRLRSGEVKVLLGARSAILANIPQLGLIILDEEHDASYKQSTPSPRYNARDLALEKARREGALVLLGSATPDLGSFERAERTGRLLTMKNRVFQPMMPVVKVVDMRKAFQRGDKAVFSTELKQALKERLEKKEQVVLLINRRGFASHIFCQACGNVTRCKNCSVSLVLHSNIKANLEETEDTSIFSRGGYLACHHCGFRQPLKEDCPTCKSPFLKVSGTGTQKVEHEVLSLHPEARVVRLDSDVAKRKGAYEAVLAQFSAGEADILIGTQMVAKGLDIPGVTLVGVLSADAAFNMPDYRSAERGFQLLTQVAGRAGRGDKPGAVVLQTYTPELPVLKLASEHDYLNFFTPELESRKAFDYPPFARLTRLLVSGEDELIVESVTEILAEELSKLFEDEAEEGELKILGPAPCLIERIKGRFRYHLIIKNRGGDRLQELLVDYLRGRQFGPEVNLAVDVDALDLV